MYNVTMLRKPSASEGHWSVAKAKACLSQVIHAAEDAPQVIENRGEAVAVVVSMESYRGTLGDPDTQRVQGALWRKFLEQSACVRADGGAEVRVPKRTKRRDPFAQ